MTRDGLDRFRKAGRSWAWPLVLPNLKYNRTDVGVAVGIVHFASVGTLQTSRHRSAKRYLDELATQLHTGICF
jgi:hypothetical protein